MHKLTWYPWVYEGIWVEHKDCPKTWSSKMLTCDNGDTTFSMRCSQCHNVAIGQIEMWPIKE